MKNHIQTTLKTFAGILIIFFASCTKKQVSILDLTVLSDNTDSFDSKLSYGDIREVYDFDRFLWYEHNLRIRELSDVQSGIVNEVHLPQGYAHEQTQASRKSQVRQYLKRNEELFGREAFQASDKSQSHIYVPVAEELNRLTKSTATNRALVIDSDLHEHNSLFDVYNPEHKALLLYHPDSVIKILSRHMELKNLEGIQVVIVHRARPETNEVYSHMARLYQMMLGMKGAKVTISGSFNPRDIIDHG